MSDYKDVYMRLAAYRKRIGMTQEQVAGKIGVSQEQYSYLEHGTTKLTDQNLESLLGLGWNIDYIITGIESDQNHKETEIEKALGSITEGEEKDFIMKLCSEIMIEKAEKYRLDSTPQAKEAIRLMKNMVRFWKDFSMCRCLREKLALSQIAMAEKTGVGIKKYREIEKERKYPDAEMLLTFYNMSGYQPILFLNYYDRKMLFIRQVWDLFEKKEKDRILEFIDCVKTVL